MIRVDEMGWMAGVTKNECEYQIQHGKILVVILEICNNK